MNRIQQMVLNLNQIVEQLRHLGRPTPELLHDGLSVTEIASWESNLPFSLTHELKSIYQWRNGTRVQEGDMVSGIYFFPGFYFLSIEEAVQTYKERAGAPQWRDGWFPVFADGGGDFYVVPCTRQEINTAEVIGFIHGEPEQVVEYESLAAMIQTLAASYAEGAFLLDDDYLEIDDEKHRQIAHRFNPGVSEWQS